MTENDLRALQLIHTRGGCLVMSASDIGFLLYPEPKKGGTRGRWPQGMALVGCKAMRRLADRDLITIKGIWDSSENEYRITQKGRDRLAGI